MTTWLRRVRHSHTAWQLAAVFAGVVVLFLTVQRLQTSLGLVVTALALAYVLDPLVEILARGRVPRGLAAIIILTGFLVVVVLAILLLVPRIAHDVQVFGGKLPDLFARAVVWIEETLGVEVPDDWHTVLEEQRAQLQSLARGAAKPALQWLSVILGSILGLVLKVFDVLLIIIFTFYFLLDWQRFRVGMWKFVPPRHLAVAQETGKEIDRVLSGWIRGMLLLVTVEAAIFAVGLSIVGIPLAIPIGIASGVLAFIPYVGLAVGLGLSVLMSVMDWQGWGQIVGVGVVFGVVQVLESAVLTPKLVGPKVGLSDIAALVAVVIGADLLGFVGMLLAIPLAATTAVILRRVFRGYQGSLFYTTGS